MMACSVHSRDGVVVVVLQVALPVVTSANT